MLISISRGRYLAVICVIIIELPNKIIRKFYHTIELPYFNVSQKQVRAVNNYYSPAENRSGKTAALRKNKHRGTKSRKVQKPSSESGAGSDLNADNTRNENTKRITLLRKLERQIFSSNYLRRQM